MESVSIYIPLFDMQKEVMWKKEFKIYSIHRIPKKEDRLDVKLKHDKISAKGDVYWVMKVIVDLFRSLRRSSLWWTALIVLL